MKLTPYLLSFFLAVAAFAAAAVAAQARDAAYGTQALFRLPTDRPGTMLVVDGQGPFRFMIDTATSHTILTPALVKRLALPVVSGPAFKVVTAAGSVSSHFYRTGEMSMAGVTVEGGSAVEIDLPPKFGIAGVLGADFLSNFLVDLDLPAQTVTLYPPNVEFRAPDLQRVRGSVNAHGFIVVPARVSNILVAAALDTGAQFTVANSSVAAHAHNIGMSLIVRPTENKIADAALQKQWAYSFDFGKIVLGPATWRDPRVLISDTRVFEEIGLARQPVVFIGMDLMAGRRIVLDYAGASLWLGR